MIGGRRWREFLLVILVLDVNEIVRACDFLSKNMNEREGESLGVS